MFSSSGKQKHLGNQRGGKASGVALLLSSASLGVMAPKENPEGLREGMGASGDLGGVFFFHLLFKFSFYAGCSARAEGRFLYLTALPSRQELRDWPSVL